MESHDHKFTTPTGHESHAPHLCHKCGWPFPNPHPSARHRRSHKKVCGKIEGYKLSESERADNSTHSAVSDDEHHSDGDQQTPSPIGGKTIVKEVSGISDKSYRSEDETFSDAVTEFSDSGICPGLEERPEGVKNLSTNVKRVDDELLKADSTGGISGSSNDARHATEVNNLESFESAINQPEVAEAFGTKIDCDPIKSEIPLDASLQDKNTTESFEDKQVQMSSEQPNGLELEDINTGEGLVDVVGVAVEVSQSVVSDTDGETSNNGSYESMPQEAEGKNSDPLNLPSDLLEADEQAADSVPLEAKLQHDENENPDFVDLKLDLSEADVQAMDDVSGDKECEQLDKVEEDKARISDQLLDGRSQTEFSDAFKTEEAREDVHVVSLAKDLPASDNPDLLLKDFKDYNKSKSTLPLDLGSSEPEPLSTDGDPSKNSLPSGSPTDHSNGVYGGSQTEFSDASKTEEAREDVHVVSLAKDLPASDNPELLLKDFKDYNKSKSSLPLDLGSSEPEPLSTDGDPSKNSLPSGSPTDHSNAVYGGSQTEFSDASKTEEPREDVHVVSLAKDLPASDNPELLLKDFKDYNKLKSTLPLDLGSSEPEPLSTDGDPSKNSLPSGSPTDHSNGVYGGSQTEFSDASKTEEAMEDVHVVLLAKDLPASDNPELLLKDFKDYNKFKSTLPLDLGSSEPEPLSTDGDPSKNSLPSGSPTDHSDMNTIISSVQEEAKQTIKVDDPLIERTETTFSMEEENKGGNPENELLANKETSVVDTSCLSETNQTTVTSDHDEHEKPRTGQPIVAGGETAKERVEEKLGVAFEGDKTICPVGGHNDRAMVTGTVHEIRDEIVDSAVSNNTKVLEPVSATELDSKIIGDDCDVKEPAGLLVDTDLNGRVVDNSHAGDGLKNATGVISSASLNEGNDKLIKQNDTVSAVDISTNSSSRADSLDANWGSVSVLSTQSESTAVPDAEGTDTCEKSERDLQKPTSGAEERHPDKSDVYEPPSFMTLVESGENANKKASAPEIEAQQPKTEALKAGWFPSITNVVNESQGRKKNEEIIAKVTNWSAGKQHTPLKNLLGEAKSPNTKQVPSVNQKDETAATKKNGATTVTTVNSILSAEAPTEQAATSKEAEKEWNSPARYPVDMKKEKRKTKPSWVPFVCCSSVHQDA